MARIFDWVILDICSDRLNTDDLQYGPKCKSSTGNFTFALMKSLSYIKRNGTNPCALMLDAIKAFNRINYVQAFSETTHLPIQWMICFAMSATYTLIKI